MPFFDIFPLLTTIFWIWMLIDCGLNQRLKTGNKIFWFLLICFTNLIGAIIYFFNACSHKNPIEAFNYYSTVLATFFQQRNMSTQAPPMYTQAYTPPPPTYADYRQGYHSRPPIYTPSPQHDQPPPYQPHMEYEQPTASYPEMPMQEQ